MDFPFGHPNLEVDHPEPRKRGSGAEVDQGAGAARGRVENAVAPRHAELLERGHAWEGRVKAQHGVGHPDNSKARHRVGEGVESDGGVRAAVQELQGVRDGREWGEVLHAAVVNVEHSGL